MKLDEVAIEDVKPGMRVWNAEHTQQGIVTAVSDKPDREDYTIDICWDNGAKSIGVWHFWCEKLEVVKKEPQL